MKKIILLAMVLGLLISGCAVSRGNWVKDDMTKYSEDKFDCDYKAQMMSSDIRRVLVGDWFDKVWYQKEDFIKCMQSKGYHYERNK